MAIGGMTAAAAAAAATTAEAVVATAEAVVKLWRNVIVGLGDDGGERRFVEDLGQKGCGTFWMMRMRRMRRMMMTLWLSRWLSRWRWR